MCGVEATGQDEPTTAELRAEAVAESLKPIHPGSPGKVPFWNRYSPRFMYAPAFEFKPVKEAVRYRFRILSQAGERRTWQFEAQKPWAALSPVWAKVPVGFVEVVVEGVNAEGEVVGEAGRRKFYRAAVWNGPYHEPPNCSYEESAQRGLRFLFQESHVQHWLSTGQPDPSYRLYCYPSKIVGAVVESMILFRRRAAKTDQEREKALQIACKAADFLISISEPADKPYEFFPPTYRGKQLTAGRFAGQIMMIYPAGVGEVYLQLYDETGEKKYLKAAERIGDTYVKRQLEHGSWWLKVKAETGEPVAPNVCVPIRILAFLEHLADRPLERAESYRKAAQRAWQWMKRGPLTDYNWQAQFEDVRPTPPYQNLQRGDACDTAVYLLSHFADSPQAVSQAEELLRFSEDQFVVWERGRPCRWNPKGRRWVTPCALEQYHYHTAIDASAASVIRAFLKAYEVTKRPLYLAKAKSLANTMTVVQDAQTGFYPTYWYVRRPKSYWFNCATYDCRVMLELADSLKALKRGSR